MTPETLGFQSMTRRGNHFVKLLPDHYMAHIGWLLIDGPWFDYLQNYPRHPVLLRRYTDMGKMFLAINGKPPVYEDYIGEQCPVWRKWKIKLTGFAVTRRYQGYMVSRLIKKHGGHYSESKGNSFFEGENRFDYSVWRRYSTIEAWQCNGGVIPASLRCVEWDDRLLQIEEFLGKDYA